MKLDNKEFKRYKELAEKMKKGTLTEEEKSELAALHSKKMDKGDAAGTPGNAFSWWNKYPMLMKDVVNYLSDYIAGEEIAFDDLPYVVPGVMRIIIDSVYGNTVKMTDPINEWSRELFLRMFNKYRIPNHYTHSDLGIVIIAAIEVMKIIVKYERIYGVITRFDKLNKNKPYAEAQALGLSMEQVTYLQGHLSDFRADLNDLIRKSHRISVMKDISAIADAFSLLGFEYLDHDSPRSQILIFDTERFGVYSDTDLVGGGSVKFVNFNSEGNALFNFDADNMCEALSNAVDALLSSDSATKIMADLYVWFTESGILALDYVPEDYRCEPLYSEEILHKLHNIETFTNQNCKVASWADPDLEDDDVAKVILDQYVYQVDDRIVTRVAVAKATGTHKVVQYDRGKMNGNTDMTTHGIEKCHVLDTYRKDPIPEIICEGCLFKFHSKFIEQEVEGVEAGANIVQSCAFWLVKGFSFFTPDGPVTTGENTNVIYEDIDLAEARAGELAIIDWAPLTYNLSTDENGIFYVEEIRGDLDNIIPMYYNGLRKLHRVVLLSGLLSEVPIVKQKS